MSTNTLSPAIMNELWSEKALSKLLTRDRKLLVDGFVMHRNFVDHLDEDCSLWLIGEGPEHMRFPGPPPGTRFEPGKPRPFGVRGWHIVYPEIPDGHYPNYHPLIRAASRFIKGTKFTFVHTVGSDDEADEYVRDMREEGKSIIPLGIGSVGPFNEHGQGAEGRARGDCTSLRVAKWGGFDKEGCYRPIMKEIVRADTEATQRLFELGREAKRAVRLNYEWEFVLDMVFTRLMMAAQEGSGMMACKDEFDKARGWFSVGRVKVGLIVSESPFALTYLRFCGADIVVKFTPGKDGRRNVLIQCRKGVESRRWFVEIATELCRRECRKKGMDGDEIEAWVEQTRIAAEKNYAVDMPGADDLWHMFEQQLMNGTFSHDRPPTPQFYAEIVDIIKVALGRVPSRGDVGRNLRDAERHFRKALELMADSGEGATAAGEANLAEITHQGNLAMEALFRARRGDESTEPLELAASETPSAEDLWPEAGEVVDAEEVEVVEEDTEEAPLPGATQPDEE